MDLAYLWTLPSCFPASKCGPMKCLGVVVPCYNEASTIVEILTRVLESPYVSEVIVVDDASRDDSVELAEVDF